LAGTAVPFSLPCWAEFTVRGFKINVVTIRITAIPQARGINFFIKKVFRIVNDFQKQKYAFITNKQNGQTRGSIRM
jgi:hypothetical protein